MRSILRQAVLLGVSAVLSWWFLLRVPASPAIPRTPAVPPQVLEVMPVVRAPVSTAELVARASEPPGELEPPLPSEPPREELLLPEQAATEAQDGEEESRARAFPAPAPPPPELGTPEGEAETEPPPAADELAREETPEPAGQAEPGAAEPDGAPHERVEAVEALAGEPQEEADASPADAGAKLEEPADAPAATEAPPPVAAGSPAGGASPRDGAAERPPAPGSIEALMSDPGLLAEARTEFARGHKKGFATVLLAAPEDQIAIARFFGEELVLVPRRAVDPESATPSYFKMSGSGEPRVETVEGAPPLERFRQYRDLLDYDYGRLPAPLRELRRSVLARGEIYLFAALLSAEEWALVIARRREALALAGRELADVRRFVLRYLHRPEDGFDLVVDEIVFADGTRFRPGDRGTGDPHR